MRLQGCDLSEQKQNPSPFSSFPGNVCLDKKKIGKHRAEPTQRGDESELADFFTEIEIYDIGKLQLPVLERERSLRGKFHHAKRENY
jgi:hypothetical protein